jgi:hypothetical protein
VAKKAVKQFGADMVTVHLISIDPLLNDIPAQEAVKTVEEVWTTDMYASPGPNWSSKADTRSKPQDEWAPN